MILITGATGRLGRELIKIIPGAFTVSHSELDVKNKKAVFDLIKEKKPSSIIHLAAMTNVRDCEEKRELAYATNVGGTENFFEACLKYNPDCYFVYMSTACVFYGDKGDYTEEDIPYPKNFYAITKLLAEFVVKRLKNYLIIRGNFVPREKWPYEKAFIDRYGTYLFADDLAKAIYEVFKNKMNGIIHIVGEEKISMFELAVITTPNIKPMTTKETDIPLTKDMSLRSVKIKSYKLTK